MRRYIHFLIIVLAAAISVTCTEREEPFGENLTGITFCFDCGAYPETKAKIDSAGVGSYNENLLSSVEYFLYPDEGTGNDAVVHG